MKPAFSITDRYGKKYLWVNDQNIWELNEKELTEDVKSAIIHAYFIGLHHMKAELDDIRIEGEFTSEFEQTG